ncbi:MAG: reverse gyrase [Candidatus Nanoclepta minutus]|uniref:Reverse gyrase n=1 Tax=Candidatus Nanoclepta minutus TaxID=1940235 RepID=A0A397WM80_9ARCH|nr:MAG: reverse gyrase [Candidatus Nanoclepta minutus]
MNFLKKFEEIDFDSIKKEIEENRKFVSKILEGKITKKREELMNTVLFIVESPNKAKTIANFFGKPSTRLIRGIQLYEVSTGNKQLIITATKGHILDLTTENIGFYGIIVSNGEIIPVYNTIKKCLNCGKQFVEYLDDRKCPYCGSNQIDDSYDRIIALQELAQEVDYVYIGTDPDYEGEAIAYFVYLLLKPFNRKIYRLEFHEVTKNAILNAIENLREIDINMVKAQIVRRVEDRWLGFSLSQIVQEKFKKKWLSAGRVQTPVLGWIVDRYFDRLNSKHFQLIISLKDGKTLVISTEIKDKKKIKEIAKKILKSEVYIKSYSEKEEEIYPNPPLITSTMLQLANRILKISVDRIMQIAQDLFEAGLITYHRTDSTRISPVGIQIAKDYISEKFGLEYFNGRSWGTGGAHEAIRPTKPIDASKLREMIESGELEVFIDLTNYHYAVYDIIFKRFIQSQMTPVRIRKFEQVIQVPEINAEIKLEGALEILKHGWDLVDQFLINMLINTPVSNTEIENVKYRIAYKYPLYTQSDIIELMRERGIGRPSTYATIVFKLTERGYVLNKGNYMVPVKLGIEVYNFLKNNFGEHVSEEKTRELENKMKILEEGKEDFYRMLKDLYSETLDIIKKWESIKSQ